METNGFGSTTKMRVVVLSADRVDNKIDGETIQGVSVNYTFNTSLRPINRNENSSGQKVAKAWLKLAQFSNIFSVPGLYDAEMEMVVGSDGKPKLNIKGLEFVCGGVFVPCNTELDAEKIAEFSEKLEKKPV